MQARNTDESALRLPRLLQQSMCAKGPGGPHGNGKDCMNLQDVEEKGQAGLGDPGHAHKEPSVSQIIHRAHNKPMTRWSRERQA